jgi:hypothetical protein
VSTEPSPAAPERDQPKRSTVRKVGASVVGGSMVAVGVPMLVLPGPGLLMIGGGLAVLASEFPAAQRALDRIRGAARGEERPR